MVHLRISCSSSHDFESKVLIVMVAIGFSLNDFDFVVNSFELSSVNLIFAVIEDAIAIV